MGSERAYQKNRNEHYNIYIHYIMTIDWSFLTRRKKYDSVTVGETKLSRVLKLNDIVALGIKYDHSKFL